MRRKYIASYRDNDIQIIIIVEAVSKDEAKLKVENLGIKNNISLIEIIGDIDVFLTVSNSIEPK